MKEKKNNFHVSLISIGFCTFDWKNGQNYLVNHTHMHLSLPFKPIKSRNSLHRCYVSQICFANEIRHFFFVANSCCCSVLWLLLLRILDFKQPFSKVRRLNANVFNHTTPFVLFTVFLLHSFKMANNKNSNHCYELYLR